MPPRGPALEGTLDDLPLPDLLAFLGAGSRTGTVSIGGANAGVITLRDGRISMAIADRGPRLDQVLTGPGLIDSEAWAAASEADDREVLAALSAGGADAERLEAALHRHIVTTLFEFVLPSSDPFTFIVDEPHDLGSAVSFPADELVAAATARLDEWKEIAESVPSTSAVPRLVTRLSDGVDAVTITAGEWQVLAALDSARSVTDLIDVLGMTTFDLCQVLHHLVLAGAVELD
jgi:hypothetical protein